MITHKSPDPDAAGSAIALASVLREEGSQVQIGCKGDSFSPQTQLLLETTGYSFEKNLDYDVDCIVVVDTNSPSLFHLEKVKASSASKILIDHHHPKQEVMQYFDEALVDENAVSTTQILFQLFKQADYPISSDALLAMAAGIFTDSAGFAAATPHSFRVFGEILEEGRFSLQQVIDSISVPMRLSEKIARLKAAQRTQFYQDDEFIIAVTEVSSFEGGVANALLYLGADVSFVGAAKKGEVRISSRAKNKALKKGLHLGRDVMPLAANLIKGDAGGHAGAAGANGTNPEALDEALRACVKETRRILKNHP